MKANNLQKINGIMLLNKPAGLTSNAVLQKVKRAFGAAKAGHTGSLDPLATGMLPICLGEATKFSQYLLDADKCYETTGCLGIKTNTSDAMGEVTVRVEVPPLSADMLSEVLLSFAGCIEQVPSMFSALKHEGRPLYHYARAGIEIERPARAIQIHSLQLMGFDGINMDLLVTCSKGTYIRNLVEDIGDALDVGAHVTRLHRRYTAGFENEQMYELDEVLASDLPTLMAKLLPVDRAISHLPILTISPEIANALFQGKVCEYPLKTTSSGVFRLYTDDKNFIGLGELVEPGILRAKRLVSTPMS